MVKGTAFFTPRAVLKDAGILRVSRSSGKAVTQRGHSRLATSRERKSDRGTGHWRSSVSPASRGGGGGLDGLLKLGAGGVRVGRLL